MQGRVMSSMEAKSQQPSHIWLYERKGGDSNPRDGSTPPNGFQGPHRFRQFA